MKKVIEKLKFQEAWHNKTWGEIEFSHLKWYFRPKCFTIFSQYLNSFLALFKSPFNLYFFHRFLIFSLFLSTVTLTVFNVIIGKPPKNLSIGVINDESSFDGCNLKDIHACFLNQSKSILFSCLLTDFLRNETYKVVSYGT